MEIRCRLLCSSGGHVYELATEKMYWMRVLRRHDVHVLIYEIPDVIEESTVGGTKVLVSRGF